MVKAKAQSFILSEEVKLVFDSLLEKLRTDAKFEPFKALIGLRREKFAFALSTKKAPCRSGLTSYAQIQCVREPVSLLTPVRYLVSVFNGKGEWDGMEKEQRELVLLHELLHVDREWELETPTEENAFTGKLVRHDLNDFRSLVTSFGVDWYESKNKNN